MKTEELKRILDSHARWLDGEVGDCADLSGANLIGADLSDANLRDANLRDANLIGANLRDANLIGADLRDAKLSVVNLSGADLRDAKLIGADLSGADLRDAKLIGADLSYADLRVVNLIGARGFLLLPAQDPRGYSWPHAVQQKDGTWRIRAGCRFFTIEEARAHWGAAYKRDRDIGDMYLYAVEWLESKLATTEPEDV